MGKYIRQYPYTATDHIHAKSYGFFHLLFDFTLTVLTCGLWLIWKLLRYMGRNGV